MTPTGYRDASTPEWTLIYLRAAAWKFVDVGGLLVLVLLSVVCLSGAVTGLIAAVDVASPTFDRVKAAAGALMGLGLAILFMHPARQTALDLGGRRTISEGAIRETPAPYSRLKLGDLMVEIDGVLQELTTEVRGKSLRVGDRIRIERGPESVHRVWVCQRH